MTHKLLASYVNIVSYNYKLIIRTSNQKFTKPATDRSGNRRFKISAGLAQTDKIGKNR